MENKINWEDVEIPVEKSESDTFRLASFVRKYSVGGLIGSTTAQRFKIKFALKNDKEKLLLDAYTEYKTLSSSASSSFMLAQHINLDDINEVKLVKHLNSEITKKVSFSLRNKLDRSNHQEILIRVKGKDKKLFKEARKWKSDYPSDYFILTIYKDRIILKDINFFMTRYLTNKILDKVIDFIGVDVLFIQPYETSFSSFLNSLSMMAGIKSVTFNSVNLHESPILRIACRRNCTDIRLALKSLIDEGKLTSFEQINNLSLKFGDIAKPLYITIEHKLEDIDPNIKALTLRFSSMEFTRKDRTFLDKYHLNENYLYYEKSERNQLKDIEQLMFKKQLKIWEETWYRDTLYVLKDLNILKTERNGKNLDVWISKNEFIEMLLGKLSQTGLNPKMISLPKFSKNNSGSFLVDLEYHGQHFLLVVFLEDPTAAAITSFKSKWLNGLSKSPLFLVQKESEYQRVKTFGDYPHLNLAETIASILDGSFESLFDSKLKEIQIKYSEERLKESQKVLKDLNTIVEKKQSKEKFREFEAGIYYLQSYLFTGTQRIGAGYLPDGIKLPLNNEIVVSNDLKLSPSIWDAKIWFSDIDVPEEKEKIARYIITSLKNEGVNSIGKLKSYFLIGHVENSLNLPQIFKESREIALEKATRFKGVHSIDIKNLFCGYIDLDFFNKVLSWMGKNDLTVLNAIGFYSKLGDFIVSKEIIDGSSTELFLKDLDQQISSLRKDVSLVNYRNTGVEVKKEFDKK